MYHCDLKICLAGVRCGAFDTIRRLSPPPQFSYCFQESESGTSAEGAHVILANLPGPGDGAFLEKLSVHRRRGARLVLLGSRQQFTALGAGASDAEDFWLLPLTDEEARFRFLRLQARIKLELDLWLHEQYLETVINSVPNLIWFKDKDGIHRNVNDSFCRIVQKEKSDVVGRGHCYIWNVGPMEGIVCSRSDYAVMEQRKTITAEEAVKMGDEQHILMTYKSPLFDLDGSVMGTVGVGMDITQERELEQEVAADTRTLQTVYEILEGCPARDCAQELGRMAASGAPSPEELLALQKRLESCRSEEAKALISRLIPEAQKE